MVKSPAPVVPGHLETQADLERAISKLLKQDPGLRRILAATGMPALRHRAPGFAGLAQIIVGQQLSTASANAIWNRMSEAFDPFHHDSIRGATAARLGKLGLSAAKIKTLKLLATEIRSKRLDLESLGELDADEAHKILTALHGVGPWTADVYLLFCLGHADAWPAGDLALQDAVRLGLNRESRPTTKEMTALASCFRIAPSPIFARQLCAKAMKNSRSC
jgi:DNA-3-methyladenine glycosylase II